MTDAGPSMKSNEPKDFSLPYLLWVVVRGLARRHASRVPTKYFNTCISVCGLIVLIAPLALWVAWTKTIFFSILGVSLTALAIIVAIAWLTPDEPF